MSYCPTSHEQVDAVSLETAGLYGRCAHCGSYLVYDGTEWHETASEEISEALVQSRQLQLLAGGWEEGYHDE